MKDKYDEEIELLTRQMVEVEGSAPDDGSPIMEAWAIGTGLFSFASKSGHAEFEPLCRGESFGKLLCGCLTQIRSTLTDSWLDGIKIEGRPDLMERIQEDARIPSKPEDIGLSDLPVFAEWQRILDRELGRPA